MGTTSIGVGDTLAKAIKAMTGGKVKPCKGCDERRNMLNKILPYKRCRACEQERQRSIDA
jgi:hypothetical protein